MGSPIGGIGQIQHLVASASVGGKTFRHDVKGVELALERIFRPPTGAENISSSRHVLLYESIRPNQLKISYSTDDALRTALLESVVAQGKSVESGSRISGIQSLLVGVIGGVDLDGQRMRDAGTASKLIKSIEDHCLNGGQTADAAAVRREVDQFLQTPSVRSDLLVMR